MSESRRARWRRRVVTVPAMLAATTAALAGLPLLVPLAVAADLVRGRVRLPTLRVYLFLLQYLVNDSVEIVAAPIYWLLAGAGTRLGSPTSVARHERLQWWSARLLLARAEQLLGLRVDVDPAAVEALAGGPVIVVSRHVSLFDAPLPAILCRRAGLRARGVVMREMLNDPGFDLLYPRLGSVFIPRDDGPAATAEIERMAAGSTAETGIIIFPEGRLFSPGARDRGLARLAEADPDRAERLAGLSRVLPPRPRGLVALLAALPEADVVVVEHTGLDRFRRLTDLLGAVPVSDPVTVTARRIPRSDLGPNPAAQTAWLDETWRSIDAALTPETVRLDRNHG